MKRFIAIILAAVALGAVTASAAILYVDLTSLRTVSTTNTYAFTIPGLCTNAPGTVINNNYVIQGDTTGAAFGKVNTNFYNLEGSIELLQTNSIGQILTNDIFLVDLTNVVQTFVSSGQTNFLLNGVVTGPTTNTIFSSAGTNSIVYIITNSPVVLSYILAHGGGGAGGSATNAIPLLDGHGTNTVFESDGSHPSLTVEYPDVEQIYLGIVLSDTTNWPMRVSTGEFQDGATRTNFYNAESSYGGNAATSVPDQEDVVLYRHYFYNRDILSFYFGTSNAAPEGAFSVTVTNVAGIGRAVVYRFDGYPGSNNLPSVVSADYLTGVLSNTNTPSTNGAPSSVSGLVTNYLSCFTVTGTNVNVTQMQIGTFGYQNGNWYSFNGLTTYPASYINFATGQTVSPAFTSTSGYFPSQFSASQITYTVQMVPFTYLQNLTIGYPGTQYYLYTVYATVTNVSYTFSGAPANAQKALNNLIQNLQTANLWSYAYAIYPFCSASPTCDAKNLLNSGSYNITWNGSAGDASAHTVNGWTNYLGDTSYGDTGFNPSLISGITNNFSIVISSPVNGFSGGSTGPVDDMAGVTDGSTYGSFQIAGGNDYAIYQNKAFGSYLGNSFGCDAFTFYHGQDSFLGFSVIGGTSYALVGTNAVTSCAFPTPGSPPNGNIYLNQMNFVGGGGATGYPALGTMNFCWLGKGLTGDQLQTLKSIVAQFNGDLGR